MEYYAQEFGPRSGRWLTIGDVAHTMDEAAAYIGRYALPGAETRIVVYFEPPKNDAEFNDRMYD